METQVIRVAKNILSKIRYIVGKKHYESWNDVLRKFYEYKYLNQFEKW